LAPASACPFCGTALNDSIAPLHAVAGILLGLTMFGCGDDTTNESVGGTQTTTMSTSETSTETGTVPVTETMTNGGSDYAGPTSLESTGPLDTSSSEETVAPESSSDSSSSDTGSESGSESSTGTDTGSSSSDTGSAESADYGGAAPKN